MPSDSLTITPADPSLIGPLYTTQEVASLLRVSQRTVQDWIRAGALPAMRYGRILRIRQADLAAFGEVMTQRTPTPAPQEETPVAS
jgi:excisionase family DNA binding protein